MAYNDKGIPFSVLGYGPQNEQQQTLINPSKTALENAVKNMYTQLDNLQTTMNALMATRVTNITNSNTNLITNGDVSVWNMPNPTLMYSAGINSTSLANKKAAISNALLCAGRAVPIMDNWYHVCDTYGLSNLNNGINNFFVKASQELNSNTQSVVPYCLKIEWSGHSTGLRDAGTNSYGMIAIQHTVPNVLQFQNSSLTLGFWIQSPSNTSTGYVNIMRQYNASNRSMSYAGGLCAPGLEVVKRVNFGYGANWNFITVPITFPQLPGSLGTSGTNYCNGTITISTSYSSPNYTATITGVGTSFLTDLSGLYIYIKGLNQGFAITALSNDTSLTIVTTTFIPSVTVPSQFTYVDPTMNGLVIQIGPVYFANSNSNGTRMIWGDITPLYDTNANDLLTLTWYITQFNLSGGIVNGTTFPVVDESQRTSSRIRVFSPSPQFDGALFDRGWTAGYTGKYSSSNTNQSGNFTFYFFPPLAATPYRVYYVIKILNGQFTLTTDYNNATLNSVEKMGWILNYDLFSAKSVNQIPAVDTTTGLPYGIGNYDMTNQSLLMTDYQITNTNTFNGRTDYYDGGPAGSSQIATINVDYSESNSLKATLGYSATTYNILSYIPAQANLRSIWRGVGYTPYESRMIFAARDCDLGYPLDTVGDNCTANTPSLQCYTTIGKFS